MITLQNSLTSQLITNRNACSAETREVLEEAVENKDWVELDYGGETRVVIPKRITDKHFKGVRAADSGFRCYTLEKVEGAEIVEPPDATEVQELESDMCPAVRETAQALEQFIADDSQVEILYDHPQREEHTECVLDPEGLVWQPDNTLAVEAKLEGGPPFLLTYRVDRILEFEKA